MGSWRKQRGENHQELHGRRRQSRKPPLGTWQPTVPSWEKKFCTLVGSVSWQKLMEGQRFKYMYKNVINWDDSAVEEAFHSAKSRFWAQINGLPCDISLPDPDIYIDEIDWESIIDPELILDLEREPEVCDRTDSGEHAIIFSDTFLQERYSHVPVVGWGSEENFPKPSNYELDPQLGNDNQNVDGNKNQWEPNWGENNNKWEHGWNNPQLGNENQNVDGSKNQWEHNWGENNNEWEYGWNNSWRQKQLEHDNDLLNKSYNESKKNMDCGIGWGHYWSGSLEQNRLENNSDLLNKNCNKLKNMDHGAGGEWGYGWTDSWEQNQLENNGDVWNKNYNEPKNVVRGAGGDWGMWDQDGKKREGSGWNMSRYKTSRFHGNDTNTDRRWRNGRWQRKLNFAYEQPHSNQVPHSNQWTGVNYCGPVNQIHHWESSNPMQF